MFYILTYCNVDGGFPVIEESADFNHIKRLITELNKNKILFTLATFAMD